MTTEGKIEKLMFIVEDVTGFELEYRLNKELGFNHLVFMEVLPFENKDGLSASLSKIIEGSISLLEKMVSPDAERMEKEEINKVFHLLVKDFNDGECSKLGELRSKEAFTVDG